jgi:hypothetical protein
VIEAEGQIDHLLDLGNNLGTAAETGDEVTDVAVVLLDGKGQVLAGKELVFGDEAVIAFPVVGDELASGDADFIEKPLTCGIVTVTQNPGDSSLLHRIIRPPEPQLVGLFFRKCHISSSVTMAMCPDGSGSGSFRASARTHLSTATSLTFRSRAIEPKLTFAMAYSSNANAFIAAGLPRGAVAVKLHRHFLQR